MFDRIQSFGAEALHCFNDDELGFRALVAIHDTRLGPAFGGCRFISYVNEDAAIEDVLKLAVGMTRKNALAGIPFGGGKAVIMRPAKGFSRQAIFRRFGEAIDGLGGQFVTAMDAGSETADMAVIASASRYVSTADPAAYTALGVALGIEAAVKRRQGDASMAGTRVAVQGLGHVGSKLCAQLSERGARLIVTDFDRAKIDEIVARYDATAVPPAQIYEVDCDVFAPCALGGVLNEDTVARLRCQIVAGAANNQIACAAIAETLRDRHIIYAPDYVINAGGVIFAALSYLGHCELQILKKINHIPVTLMHVMDLAERALISTEEAAEGLSRQILDGPASRDTTPMLAAR
ncbi:MAG: Glu/Leu/Phe/Val dehydrogenase dimerization domain-containing protein [Pseudomonadales bacterium]